MATGFRAPTIQDRLEDDPKVTTADSETIMSYEIGYKVLFEKVRLNMAAFYYEVDDMQLGRGRRRQPIRRPCLMRMRVSATVLNSILILL